MIRKKECDYRTWARPILYRPMDTNIQVAVSISLAPCCTKISYYSANVGVSLLVILRVKRG